MKKFLALLAAVAALTLTASAQNFEGTITWAFKVAMSGDMAQQMQGAQSMMNDPAMLKEMQAAMNNPQMKAMMEGNPQMKAMMDQMTKGRGAATGGNLMDNMLPKSIAVKIKGNSSLSIIEGGMTAGEILTLADKNVAYLIDRASRSYSVVTQGTAAAAAPAGQFKITRTNETATILGYSCRKTVVQDSSGGPVTSYTIWSTTGIAGADSKQFARMKLAEGSDTSFMSSIEGVPMRMEIAAEGMKITMETTTVKKESLADSLFALPAGFTERKLPKM